MLMPILTLSYISWATLCACHALLHAGTLRMEYVTTVRQGFEGKYSDLKHAQPNAMIPVITLAGFQVIGLLGGVVITETCLTFRA